MFSNEAPPLANPAPATALQFSMDFLI